MHYTFFALWLLHKWRKQVKLILSRRLFWITGESRRKEVIMKANGGGVRKKKWKKEVVFLKLGIRSHPEEYKY